MSTIQGAEHAGISEVGDRNHQLATIAATGEVVERIDRLHSETGQGPGSDVIHNSPIVRVDDLTHEQRWPLFGPGATDFGMRAMLSVPGVRPRSRMGNVGLVLHQARCVRRPGRNHRLLLASYATLAVTDTRDQQHLRDAVQSRDIIGQAKGILMERHQFDDQQAFALLVRISQNTNRRLIDIADRVARTGEEPIDAVAHIPSRDQPPRAAAN